MSIAAAFTDQLEALRQHIEHGAPFDAEDRPTPALLLFAAMKMGRLSPYRGARVAGALSALTHKAECFQRAHDVSAALNLALELRLDAGTRSG